MTMLAAICKQPFEDLLMHLHQSHITHHNSSWVLTEAIGYILHLWSTSVFGILQCKGFQEFGFPHNLESTDVFGEALRLHVDPLFAYHLVLLEEEEVGGGCSLIPVPVLKSE